MDAACAMSVLADQVDPSVNEMRGLGNTISVHTTMTSLVLCPNDGRAYMAVGTAPVAHSQFVEIPLAGTFDCPESFPTQLQVIDNSNFTKAHPQTWSALQLFITAKCAYENQNDVRRAYQLLQETVRTDPSNPAYYFQLGIFALKDRRFEEACHAFDAVLSCPYVTPQLRRLALYYRGRTHAHHRDTFTALQDLSAVIADEHTSDQLRSASQRAIRRTKTFGRCRLRPRSLMIMMQQSDMLHY
jgi:hypothetical protein